MSLLGQNGHRSCFLKNSPAHYAYFDHLSMNGSPPPLFATHKNLPFPSKRQEIKLLKNFSRIQKATEACPGDWIDHLRNGRLLK